MRPHDLYKYVTNPFDYFPFLDLFWHSHSVITYSFTHITALYLLIDSVKQNKSEAHRHITNFAPPSQLFKTAAKQDVE